MSFAVRCVIKLKCCHIFTLSDALLLHTVYCAVGLASYELYDFVDFDNWFTTNLTADLNVSHSKLVSFAHAVSVLCD